MIHTPVKRRRVLVAACAASALLALGGGLTACGGDDNSGAASTATTTEAQVVPLAPPGTPLAAGTYRSDEFKVPFEFTIDDKWTTGGPELPIFFDLAAKADPSATLWLLTMEQATDPKDPSAIKVVDVADPVTFLHEHPDLTTGPTEKATIDQRPAMTFSFKVKPDAGYKIAACPVDKCVTLGSFPTVGYGWIPGEEGQIYVVDEPEPLVIIYSSHGFITPHFEEDAEKVIKTITFT